MRNALLVLVVFGSVLLTAGETRGQCTCTNPNITAREEFNAADVVFVGKVIAVKKTAPDKEYHYVETVTFQVTRAWKREVKSTLTIRNEIYGCVNGFDENEEFLIYAYSHPDGTFGTGCCCSRTTLLTKAADDLKAFADEPPAKILQPQTPKPE